MTTLQKEASTKTYNISDLAAEFDVTARSIRFYEDQDLLSPERIGRNRLFHERDRVRLKLILRGKRLGFSLAEIREIFDLYDSEPGEEAQLRYLIDSINQKRAALSQQREDIDAVLLEMDEVEQRVRKSLAELKI
jgi:DNA-binding transcriptional MerR regulator